MFSFEMNLTPYTNHLIPPPQTRVMIAPTVRHAIRINSVIAVFDVCVANHATCASKSWV